MSLQSLVEQPVAGFPYYRQRIPVEGWIYADYRHERLRRISAHAPAGAIGSTTHLFRRDAITTSLRLPAETRTGFRFTAAFDVYPLRSPTTGIEIRAEFTDGSIVPIAGIHVALLENDFTGGAYGDFCNPQHTAVRHREHVYAAAIPAEAADDETIRLLADYLSPGESVVDVGCGSGAYCDPVRKLGHAWLGMESRIDRLHGLALRSRPHRAIPKPIFPWSRLRLPGGDQEFAAALCVDTLAHVEQPDPLIAEIARITKRHAFFSVPNGECLPFMADRLLAPRHLLDARQRNIFTRFSLRPLLLPQFRNVEVLDYGNQPTASVDGLPLPTRLMAICEV
ncbi:MAG: methyltransferase domain-containing protein [Opitutus sp.]